MPIKDVEQKYYLPRLGKIHLGYKDPDRGFPVRTDYFVCPPEVKSLFGDKPKQLRIMIPVSNDELWRSEYYRYYTRSRGLICKGDGEMCVQMRDIKTGRLPTEQSKEFAMVDVECKGRQCEYYQNKLCRRVMNLQFMIPEVPGLGVYQIDTSGGTSITNIKSAELFIKAIYGRVNGIPLILELKPVDRTNLSDGKKHTVYAMQLNTTGTLAQLALDARQQAAVMAIELTGNGQEDEDDENDPAIVASPEQVQKDIDELWPDNGKNNEAIDVQVIRPEPKPEIITDLKRDPTTITAENFLSACYQDYNSQPKDAFRIVGNQLGKPIKTVRDIPDCQLAYTYVAAAVPVSKLI